MSILLMFFLLPTFSFASASFDFADELKNFNLDKGNPVDILRSIGQKASLAPEGLKDFQKAKSSDPLFQNIQLKESYKKVKENGKFGEYLLGAIKSGGPTSILQNYLISFLMEDAGLQEEATYYFNKAEMMKTAYSERIYSKMVRPLQFAYPEFYSSVIELPRFSTYQLHTIIFPQNEQLKELDFAIENELDGAAWFAHIAAYGGYNSNILKLQKPADLPAGIKKESGTEQNYLANLSYQTSPVKSFCFGLDYFFLLHLYTRSELEKYESYAHVPSIWVSLWNKKSSEVRLRYDLGLQYKDSTTYKLWSQTHGPQLAWSQLVSKKYQLDLSYSREQSYFPGDLPQGFDQRSGVMHSLTARVSYPSSRLSVQPFFKYRFDLDRTEGLNVRTNVHTAELGTGYFLNDKTTLNITSGYQLIFQPGKEFKERLQLKQFSLGATYRVLKFLNLYLNGSLSDKIPPNTILYSYQQWKASLGAVFGGAY